MDTRGSDVLRERVKSRVHLHGFVTDAVEQVLRRVAIEPATAWPPIEVLEDVVAIPTCDALYDRTGALIPSTRRNFIPADLTPKTRASRIIADNHRTIPLAIEIPPE